MNKGKDHFGRYFDDFKVEDVFYHWPGKTITEYDNHNFSLLTMNHHPLHLDMEFAKKSQHKRILVVGTYIFSLVVGQSVRDVSGKAIANLEYDIIIHHKPVFIGDTIYSKTVVLDKKLSKTKGDRGIVYVETTAYNQDDVKVLSFKRKVLIPKREHANE